MGFRAYWDYLGFVDVELRAGDLAPVFKDSLGVVEAILLAEI